jgi:hypothetical protein
MRMLTVDLGSRELAAGRAAGPGPSSAAPPAGRTIVRGADGIMRSTSVQPFFTVPVPAAAK